MINKHWFNERLSLKPVRSIIQVGGTAYINLRTESQYCRDFIIQTFEVYKMSVVFT
jgi:hypothetical protein